LRNIFDQYSQPENRVTHALMTAINEDRNLLDAFLRELINVKPPIHPNRLSVLEQQFPGEEEISEDELERRGIPDGWIFDETGWCVFIETKVLAKLTSDQINRHRRTAERRGFQFVTAVAIAPRPFLPTTLPHDTVLLEWRSVYGWLRRHSLESTWAAKAAEYLEITEEKLVYARQFVEGTLTMFSGFSFGIDHPFTYLEGKRVLELALAELRMNSQLAARLGMNPSALGRPAITGRRSNGVWDFLSLSAVGAAKVDFTSHPHLTLGILSHAVEAMVTVPNAVNNIMRRNIVHLGEDGFRTLVQSILNNLAQLLRSHEGAVPWFRGVQRRYPSQRAVPFIDATIDFDLRTAIASEGPPKTQPRWLSAAYGFFVNKEHSNYQMQLGVIFPYERCLELRQADAIELIATAWVGCKPLIDLAQTAG
jgi:hypothetical protein